MSVSGDFAELRRLASRFEQIGREMPRIASDMGDESLKLNRAAFRAQETPEGESWVNGPYTSSPKLRRSGRLSGSIQAARGALSFGTKVIARYAWYHQTGAHLRAAIVGSAGRLRSRSFGPGRGKSGPTRKVRQSGPIRKGRLRGFLPARSIVPNGDVPTRWVPLLTRVAARRIERALGY